ncbi:unnamed protein product [Mytilus coruscus]|uniref:B box-type domain-containing protein n=1 Tax=Mytilus coruscus TaxID=42192 RepID=A0A6J8CBG5_MYTCO|nr:unnamed protein product [Mytilus coruscus]
MASSKPILCGPCHKGEVNTKADICCYNCDEGLCSTCLKHHKQSKGTHDHKTIDIKSYKSFIRDVKAECDKHGQQLNFHSKCTGIQSLAGVVEKSKIEKSKETVETDINYILNLLEKIINNKSKNIKTAENQCVSIKKSIGEIRQEINKHLDHLEKKLCQEADTIWNQEKSKATDFITEIEGKTKNLKIERRLHQCQRYVDDLENDERTTEFDIKMKQNNEIEKILSQLGTLESWGEVVVIRTEVAMNRETSVKREAQVELQEQTNINNMTMNIETKIDINIGKDISDMICLIDGRVIVVEEWGKVNLLTSNGKLQKQLPIPDGAHSVTQINQDTIAITYPGEKAIKIFNMENETVTKVITLNKACYNLSFSNNSLAVGLSDDEICIIDLEGNTLKSTQVQSESLFINNLVYCNDRVIFSDYDGDTVYCLDGSGKQIWQYTQDLSGPMGLCTDTYGNIIIADCGSDNIIVTSKDGQYSKVLMSKENGLSIPRCVCFKNNELSGFICDYNGNYLAKFNLSHE